MVPLDPILETRLTAHNSIVQAARLLTNNTILLSTSKNGVFELNLLAKELKALPVRSGLVTQIFQDSRQNVWMGTYDKGLFADYYYKEKFGGSDNYLNRAIDHSSVLAVALDHQQNLWISTLSKGLFVCHSTSQQIEAIPFEELPMGEQKNAITHIFCDGNGLLWFSTSRMILKCHYNGSHLTILQQTPAIAVMDFEQDDEGTVWASTSTNDIMGFPCNGEPIVKQAFNADFCFIPSLLKLNDGQILISAFSQNILASDGVCISLPI